MFANLSSLRARELYSVPEGWDPGTMSIGPDGTHVTLVETQSTGSRVRMIALVQGTARTVIEAPFLIEAPTARPMRAQLLYRQGRESVWMTGFDGTHNRKLALAAGGIGSPNWSPDGKSILYLNFPEDRHILYNIREFNPDTNSDKMLDKTSQFAAFSPNRDASVFVGASRNVSPAILLLVRATGSERTMCEHKASNPESVAPLFSPDSQAIYFQSDRHGKPAIYSMRVERLVEKTDAA
jgi:oligogalacturonide lyase